MGGQQECAWADEEGGRSSCEMHHCSQSDGFELTTRLQLLVQQLDNPRIPYECGTHCCEHMHSG